MFQAIVRLNPRSYQSSSLMFPDPAQRKAYVDDPASNVWYYNFPEDGWDFKRGGAWNLLAEDLPKPDEGDDRW